MAHMPQLMQASERVTLYLGTWCLNRDGIDCITTLSGFIWNCRFIRRWLELGLGLYAELRHGQADAIVERLGRRCH